MSTKRVIPYGVSIMREVAYVVPLYPKQADDADGPLPDEVYCGECNFWDETLWRRAYRRLAYWDGPGLYWGSGAYCHNHLTAVASVLWFDLA